MVTRANARTCTWNRVISIPVVEVVRGDSGELVVTVEPVVLVLDSGVVVVIVLVLPEVLVVDLG